MSRDRGRINHIKYKILFRNCSFIRIILYSFNCTVVILELTSCSGYLELYSPSALLREMLYEFPEGRPASRNSSDSRVQNAATEPASAGKFGWLDWSVERLQRRLQDSCFSALQIPHVHFWFPK